jgi:hypothetical protein
MKTPINHLDKLTERRCACGCTRRSFITNLSLATGAMALMPSAATSAFSAPLPARKKQGTVVRAAFIYTPSQRMAEDPNGWWSWPGTDYDADGHQKKYSAALGEMEKKLGMKILVEPKPIENAEGAQQFVNAVSADRPDGVLLVLLHNFALAHADTILQTVEKAGIPAVFYIGLGVKHGPVGHYRRPGLYFIQSLDNLDAIEYGMRMINTKKSIGQSRILSVTEGETKEFTDPFLGVTTQVVPFARYAAEFARTEVGDAARKVLKSVTGKARRVGVTRESLENAMRAYFALRKLLADENADGVMMNCLRRGMLKPCLGFSLLNSALVPAACENDIAAAHGQMLGQMLTGRPGFQHNPAFETESNHYYASHCTCPTKMNGPGGADLPYLLRRFCHTNEGSTAVQVFWKPGDRVTMMHYYAGSKPTLDVHSGTVVKSHEMPPAGGCTTNVEIEITDCADVCAVKGHHNLLFCGDHARKFAHFARLYRMQLKEGEKTHYEDPV